MPDQLRWPDDFENPTPRVTFIPGFTEFLENMRLSGFTIIADRHWSVFDICQHPRSIGFIVRGIVHGPHYQMLGSPGIWWEVRPSENGVEFQLGPLCSTRKHACVVVPSLPDIRLITIRWLGGMTLADSIRGITLWNRADLSSPLKLIE